MDLSYAKQLDAGGEEVDTGEEEAGSKHRRGQSGRTTPTSDELDEWELPTYEGLTNKELKYFLLKLSMRRGYFSRWPDVDHIYAAVWKFQGHVKSRWCEFYTERKKKGENKQVLTWDEFVKWLTDAVPNRPTLQLRAVKILHEELRQKEGQKVQDFLHLYLDAEAELMVTLPDSYRVCAALHKLQNHFYRRIVSWGLPSTWCELWRAAQEADAMEDMLRLCESSRWGGSDAAGPHVAAPTAVAPSVETKHSASLASNSAQVPPRGSHWKRRRKNRSSRRTCFRCGVKGHLAAKCPHRLR